MTSNDVATVIAQAATRASQISFNSVIAVVDREGYVLGVWSAAGSPQDTNTANCGSAVAEAIGRAGTAAFLSSDQQAFTTRTALMIVQQNFPPGVRNKPPGPLVGVNFTQLQFSDINRYKNPTGYDPIVTNGTNGAIVPTPCLGGLDGLLGGVPLYKDGTNLVGGVGVFGDGNDLTQEVPDLVGTVRRRDMDEDVALAGQIGFEPARKIRGDHVLIDGIRIPYVRNRAPRLELIAPVGSRVLGFAITNSPSVYYPPVALGGVTGEIRAPIIDDPASNFTAADITNILALAAQRASHTRTGIRLPRGVPAQVFITVVNNAGVILGTFRTGEATIFSWDVAAQKARTALYFSSALATNFFPAELPIERAYSTRAIGFLAQTHDPPEVGARRSGPLLGVQEGVSGFDGFNPLNEVNSVPAPDANLPNGMTIFPGGFPLYKDGVLIGAIGVSGDGIDQDDLIAIAGAAPFAAPEALRSDHISYRGNRLPYSKFPRNPSL